MKQCAKCKLIKPLSKYYKRKRSKDGYDYCCMDCVNERNKKWQKKNRNKVREAKSRWRKNNMERHVAYNIAYGRADKIRKSAHNKTIYAIRVGKLIRKSCEICGGINSHAHHEDYKMPLDVNWLCPLHHGIRHTEMRRENANV